MGFLLANCIFLTAVIHHVFGEMNARASLLRDLNPGSRKSDTETVPFSSYPSFTNIQGRLFISALSDPFGDFDLWSQTAWVADPDLRRIHLLNGTDPIKFYQDSAMMDSVYIFTGSKGVFRYNLTTTETTDIVLDDERRFSEAGYQFFEHSTEHDDLFCFQAIPTTTGFEMICFILGEFSTTSYTIRGVKNPKHFVSFQGLIVFSGDDANTNAAGKLYYANVTSAIDFEGESYSLAQLVDIGVEFDIAETPTVVNNKLFIRQANHDELWVLNHDLTLATRLVDPEMTNRYGQLTSLEVVNDRVVFAFMRGLLWSTDGESIIQLFDRVPGFGPTPYYPEELRAAIFRGNLYVASLNSMEYTNGTHSFFLRGETSFTGPKDPVPISDDKLCFFSTERKVVSGQLGWGILRCTTDGENVSIVPVTWPKKERPIVQLGAVDWDGSLIFRAYTETEGMEPWKVVFEDSSAASDTTCTAVMLFAVLVTMISVFHLF